MPRASTSLAALLAALLVVTLLVSSSAAFIGRRGAPHIGGLKIGNLFDSFSRPPRPFHNHNHNHQHEHEHQNHVPVHRPPPSQPTAAAAEPAPAESDPAALEAAIEAQLADLQADYQRYLEQASSPPSSLPAPEQPADSQSHHQHEQHHHDDDFHRYHQHEHHHHHDFFRNHHDRHTRWHSSMVDNTRRLAKLVHNLLDLSDVHHADPFSSMQHLFQRINSLHENLEHLVRGQQMPPHQPPLPPPSFATSTTEEQPQQPDSTTTGEQDAATDLISTTEPEPLGYRFYRMPEYRRFESPQRFLLAIYLPAAADLDVSVDDGVLTVSAQRSSPESLVASLFETPAADDAAAQPDQPPADAQPSPTTTAAIPEPEPEREPERFTALDASVFEPTDYRISFQLPKTVDADAISAVNHNGVLFVSLPKRATPPRVRVSIKNL